MDWLNLHISTTVRSPEYVGSSPEERGTWVSVLAYACEIECGGRLSGAASWKNRQWQQACGVTLREVRSSSRLMRFEGDDLVINGYPVAKEHQVKQARGVGMAGAMKRWGKNVPDSTVEPMPTGIPVAMPVANAEGKGREGKGREEEITHEESDICAMPVSNPLIDDAQRWGYVRAEPWARNLIAAGCKIGTGSWPAWKALCERWPLARVIELAATVPATERFSGQVEEALRSAGTASTATLVARKTRTLDLSA